MAGSGAMVAMDRAGKGVPAGPMPSDGPVASATLCCETSPAGVPASWATIPLDELDGAGWRRLATADRARALALAARDFPPAEPPADKATIRACIGGLRLGTIPRDESAEEQLGRANMLQSMLKGVPADVLKAACAAYVREHKWFPAPAELLPYVEAARKASAPARNAMRWRRLNWLAERAAAEKRAAAIAADPVDPAAVAALLGRLGSALAVKTETVVEKMDG